MRDGCPEARVVNIGVELLECLEKLHDAGYVHCDIKPDNVMISGTSGKAFLIDFGLAHKLFDETG